MAALGLLAGPAEAATTSSLATSSIVATPSPGCEPKGLWGAQVSTSGSLTAGTYRYAVTATGTSAPACPSIAVTVAANSIIALQWNPAPGASGYAVSRGPTDATLAPVTLTVTCGTKCVAIDTGAATPSGSAPALAGSSFAAADHTDVSLVQAIDYGGTPGDNSDDPTSNNPADVTPPALKTDVIHFPAGLLLDPTATTASCPLSGSAPSLLGSLALHGRQDPSEDTCPGSSLIGTIQIVTRTPNGVSLVPGDVYRGIPAGAEFGRLLIAVRPLCSFHNPIAAPNSASCNAALGGSDNELDTEYVSVSLTSSELPNGVSALDAQAFDVSSGADQSLPTVLPIRNSTGVQVSALTLQHRRLTLTLFGYADQATAATADDNPFVTLPSCGTTEFSAAVTTWADATGASASVPFSALAACPSPPATSTPAPVAAPVMPRKKKCKKGRVRKHGKCVKKKKRR